MFEKEAEDKAFEKYPIPKVWNSIDLARNAKYEEGFKDGAEFGYNKAMNELGYRIVSAYSEGVAFGKDKAKEDFAKENE